MKIQTVLIPLALISFVAFDGVFVAGFGARTGGWKAIKDIKDSHVNEVGQFAVSQYNKDAKANLKFNQVVRGETQLVAGENYRLVLSANAGGRKNNYEAIVWEKAWLKYMNLTSFKRV